MISIHTLEFLRIPPKKNRRPLDDINSYPGVFKNPEKNNRCPLDDINSYPGFFKNPKKISGVLWMISIYTLGFLRSKILLQTIAT